MKVLDLVCFTNMAVVQYAYSRSCPFYGEHHSTPLSIADSLERPIAVVPPCPGRLDNLLEPTAPEGIRTAARVLYQIGR